MSNCVVSHGVAKDGQPKVVRAADGDLCAGHSKRLRQWLQEIAVDYTLLETVVQPGSGKQERRAKNDEAAAPLNLAIAALRDAGRGEAAGAVRRRGDELWYELPDIPSVLATVHNRAEEIRCIHDPSRDFDPSVKDRTVIGEINYLVSAWPTLVTAAWVDEAFEEIKQAWIALQRAHDRPQPRALGPCTKFDCDGTVWPRQEADPWCSKCKRLYTTAADLAKVRIERDKQRKRKAAAS